MKARDARDHLLRALEADLIGPFDPDGGGRETLKLPPSRWYLAGFLAPSEDRVQEDPTQEDELSAGNDEDDLEQPPAEPSPKRATLFPASFGLSVLLPAEASEIVAAVTWADYTAVEPEPVAEEAAKKKGRAPRERPSWLRVPRPPKELRLPLDAAALAAGIEVPGSEGLWLMGRLAPAAAPGLEEGARALSLFLVNRRPVLSRRRIDESYVFQVGLALRCEQKLLPRPNLQDVNASDWDARVADLQYRDNMEHAVGHGVAVEVLRDEGGEVSGARTCWLPRADVKPVLTRTCDDDNVTTSMERLAALPDGKAARAALQPLVEEYGRWIEAQAARALGGGPRGETQHQLLEDARHARARIEEGIALLEADAEVFQAFCWANEAMALAERKARPASEPHWRLFQLAFVLLNLPGLTDEAHAERDTAELIFFPTGGGKTQAYLGVIAYTLLLRRMRGQDRPDGGLGIAVLLRYTLRLLTLDQLQRAATLICALEIQRRQHSEALGKVRFAIGLWVGRTATANTLHEVAQRATEYKNSTSENAASPFPLTDCPWCGHPLEKASIDIKRSGKRPVDVVVACTNLQPACDFSARKSPGGLPVLFVDEQVYRELPCFLLATVDKFALLPWRGETGKLFGKVAAAHGGRFYGPTDGSPPLGALSLPGGLLPPALIVQDELHLISGPLGTMVGLYETAIETLCTRKTTSGGLVRPKIIASTATVRRAREQIRSLFGRSDTRLFPPPGPDAMETFFAEVDRAADGRLYLGVAAPGRAMKAVLMRVYTSLLAAAEKLFDDAGDAEQAADAYMTVAGYFNALRELGGMRRLVEDEVSTRLRKATERKPEDFSGRHPWYKNRDVKEPVELTSREKTWRIKQIKAALEEPHVDKQSRVDVLLASNMISVGVDIDRLGLMVVAGQPKSTNEYIQATSRVGRKADRPGLVVTVLNVHKPRDRSHYERFTTYHECFYRFVEATSVTPFSGPALDRGLAGLLIAMTRHADLALTSPEAVMKLHEHRKLADDMARIIAKRGAWERSEDASEQEVKALRETLEARCKSLLDAWEGIVKVAQHEAAAQRSYSPWDPERKGKPLLFQSLEAREGDTPAEQRFSAPSSMRDVEPSVHLWLRRGPLGGRRPGHG